MHKDLSRRELLQHATLAAGLTALGGVWTEGAAKASRSPNEKLYTAHIGVGGQGASDLAQISADPTVTVVALCDVDDARAADSFSKFPKARKYKDFRKLLEESKDIDAVVVTIPDHMHAPAAVMAMKHGKHVYCQKPLAHSVAETRRMQEVARQEKVVTQMGTQGHPTYARLVEIIQSGAIGPVHEVHVQTDRPAGWWPQGIERPTEAQPVPATLDWDLWQGVARPRPYNSAYLPFVWRGWWDYGTGAPGDMGCHLMDGPFWSLNLKYPTAVEAKGEPLLPDSGPKWSVVTFEFPARSDMPPVKVIWHDGGQTIPADLLEGIKLAKDFNGSLFIGEKGKALVYHGTGEPKLLPEKDFADYKGPAPTIPRYDNHYKQWTDACRGIGTTSSNFDYACPLTETVLLGNVAFRTGKRLEWDAANMRATNAPEADRFIHYHYRRGWSL